MGLLLTEKIQRLADFLSQRSIERGGQAVKLVIEPKTWGGIQIERSADGMLLTSHMADHIVKVTKKWLPSLVETGKVPEHVPQGIDLRKALDALKLGTAKKLTSEGHDFNSLTGDLRWMTQRVLEIVRATHKLSSVLSAPPKGSLNVALGVLACAYEHRLPGYTWNHYEGMQLPLAGALRGTVDKLNKVAVRKVDGEKLLAQGAPPEPLGSVDATWNLSELPEGYEAMELYEMELASKPKDVFALAITARGALVLEKLQNIGVYCGSSAQTELLGLLKLSDLMVTARLLWCRLGHSVDEPSTLVCDAEAALRASAGETGVLRLKHMLRRVAIIVQRVRAGELQLAHIPDAAQYVDFLTKWVDKGKLRASIDFLTGAAARARHAEEMDDAADATALFLQSPAWCDAGVGEGGE